MKIEHREFDFNEWDNLSISDKREIINNYWSPFNPENGKKTREEIIKNLKKSIPGQLDYCEFRYFGFYAEAIFVIPSNPKIRIPRSFSGLIINKGKILKELQEDLWKVKWRDSGTEELKFKSTIANKT